MAVLVLGPATVVVLVLVEALEADSAPVEQQVLVYKKQYVYTNTKSCFLEENSF
jgi:hypothetical protein